MDKNKVESNQYIMTLSDFGFKRIFASDKDKSLLIDLLNVCLSKDFGIITDISYLPTEQLGEHPDAKKVVFDIYCRNQNNDRFIIEMQRAKQPYFFKRVSTYASRIISNETHIGDDNYQIPRVASLNILDYEMSEFCNSDRYFWEIKNKDNDNNIFFQSPAYYFIELSKFARLNKSPKELPRLGKWLYLLKHIHEMEHPPQWVIGDAIFERVFELCNYKNLDTMERANYNKSILEYADVREAVNYARFEGEVEGRKQIIESTVLRMLSLGLDLSLISEVTELSVDEIKRLGQKL